MSMDRGDIETFVRSLNEEELQSFRAMVAEDSPYHFTEEFAVLKQQSRALPQRELAADEPRCPSCGHAEECRRCPHVVIDAESFTTPGMEAAASSEPCECAKERD